MSCGQLVILVGLCISSAPVCAATDACMDNSDFVDEQGHHCADWRGDNCSLGEERYDYSQEGVNNILANCPATCGACSPRCLGDPSSWHSGYGLCEVYALPSNYWAHCDEDSSGGMTATQVCAECGVCRRDPTPQPTPAPTPAFYVHVSQATACEDGHDPVTTVEGCQAAARALDKVYAGSVGPENEENPTGDLWEGYLSGCVDLGNSSNSNQLIFNTGGSQTSAHGWAVCIASQDSTSAPTPAPPPPGPTPADDAAVVDEAAGLSAIFPIMIPLLATALRMRSQC